MHSNSLCDRLRSTWLDAAPEGLAGAEFAGELRTHLVECAACGRVVRAWPSTVRALSELPRHSAPRELDSAVVAAIQAGARTERAVRSLERLARLTPPEELADALEQPVAGDRQDASPPVSPIARASAPRVLERLVSEELSDPAKARVRRHVGGLRRLTAPAQLTSLVEQRLRSERARSTAAAALRLEFRRRMRLALGAAAAFALVALVLLVERPQDPTLPKPRPFRVERASSLASLSPITRGMLDNASSGLSQAQRD